MINEIKTLKVNVEAGKANASPPLGPTLGQAGINIIEFCKDFNKKSENYIIGTKLPVKIFALNKGKYTYDIKSPTATSLLKEVAQLAKCSSNPKIDIISYISLRAIYEVANLKLSSISNSIEKEKRLKEICKILISSAKSIGIQICD